MRNESRTAYLNIPRLALDAVLVSVSWGAAILAARIPHPEILTRPLTWMPILYTLTFLSIMNGLGLYDMTAYTFPNRTLRGVVSSCLIASLVSCLMLPFQPVTRETADVLAFFCLSGITILGIRYFLTFPAGNRASSRLAVHTLFVGEVESIRNYLDHLGKTSYRIQPVGYLTVKAEVSGVLSVMDAVSLVESGRIPITDSELGQANDGMMGAPSQHQISCLGSLSELAEVLDQNVVDEVVVAWKRQEMDSVDELLRICTSRGMLTRVVLDVWQTEKAHSHMHSIGPLPVLVYHRSHLSMPQQSVKRGMDLLFGLMGLLVFAIASLVLIPVIRLSSKGPAFILIERTGRNGRPFRQLRFRIHQDGYSPLTRNQNEMTGVGRFLFYSRLHYLPSFWNVLIGNMSMVGTRGSLSIAASRKVELKPGITGLWHVWDFDRLLDEAGLQELDETYATQWNLWLDVRILLQTPVISIIHRIIGHMPGGEAHS